MAMTPEEYCNLIKRQGTYFTEADVIKAIRQAIADVPTLSPEDAKAIAARNHYLKKCDDLAAELEGAYYLANSNMDFAKTLMRLLVQVLRACPEHEGRVANLPEDQEFQYGRATKMAKGEEPVI